MYMVQHMATTLIAGRARVCGVMGRQIKYSIFPKGANQRTFLPIRARIDWYRFCIGLHIAYVCTHVRMHMHVKGQIKCTNFMPGANQNARNPSPK